MCGIVAYLGPEVCAPILVDGLRRLEYRGYDSAGLAILPDKSGESLQIIRTVGKLHRLADAISRQPVKGHVGIGHTRWATHGKPSEANAHPHSVDGVAVVHNGIIENHLALKNELISAGRKFSSETDTEIIAHLVAMHLEQVPSLAEAVRHALQRLSGAYAIAVVAEKYPNTIVVARMFSPLVLGVADNEIYAASDVPAIIPYTRDIVFLEDGDIAEMSRLGNDEGASLRIFRTDSLNQISRPTKRIEWSPAQAEKQGYKHFMLKEIYEQPTAVENTLRGRIIFEGDQASIDALEIGLSRDDAKKVQRVVLLACGTSHHATLAARNWFESIAKVPAVSELASEFRYRQPVVLESDLVIAVSQSGETADTLAAIREASRHGARIHAVVNVVGSAIARAAHGALYTHAGPEIGVASTKCFTTQLSALFLLAVHLGVARGTLTNDQSGALLREMLTIPRAMREALKQSTACHRIAKSRLIDAHNALFLGRGLSYGIALEGALKLKEVSYVHAEGYAAGEMKHGPIALIDSNLPVVVIAPNDQHHEKIASNVQEVRAREGLVIAIVNANDELLQPLADDVVVIPTIDPQLTPFVTVIPLQLLAYFTADLRGTDVDQPRNLAKTVTVE